MNFIKRLLEKIFGRKKEETVTKPIVTPPDITETSPKEESKAEELLWYPKATKPINKMNGAGTYKDGYPQGAIVHFTAGRDEKVTDAMDSYEWGRGEGYVFFVIGIDGEVIQGFPLNVRGSHAGVSSWPSLGDGVSKYLVGIEICCAGKLEKKSDNEFVSWFKKTYTKDQVRYVTEEEINGEGPTGYYKKFTPAQEKSLIELLVWLKKNNPDVFNVDYILSHSEVAGMKTLGYWRKNDVSGALSMSMKQLRELVRSKVS